jgi:type I restriction enzyme S subunit
MQVTSKSVAVERNSLSKLPDGWRMVKLGDVVEKREETERNPEAAGFERFLKVEHLDADSLKIKRWGLIKEDGLPPTFYKVFRKGQVLYPTRNPHLRRTAYADFDGICGEKTLTLQAKEKYLISNLLPFLFQCEAFIQHASISMIGSTNPHVRWKDIAAYQFALPPQEDQPRITDILLAADENIYRFEDCLSKVILYKTALFEHLIQRGLSKIDSSQRTYWKEVKFESLMIGSPKSGYSAVSASRETGHFVLALSALSRSGYQAGHLKPVELTPEVEATRLNKGDFLISRSSTYELVGLVGIFDEEREDTSFPDTMMLIRLDESRVDKQFIEQFLLSKKGRLQIQRIAAGTSASMKKINRTGLASIVIPLPPLDVQRKIVEQLDACTKAIDAVKTKLNSCRELKKGLLKEFFEDNFERQYPNV